MNTVRDLTVRLMFHRDLRQVLFIERRNLGTPWTRQNFRAVFHGKNTNGWVAEINDAVVGYIVFRTTGNGTTILNLSVAPYWRRQGVGRAILEKLMGKRETNLHAIVPESNLPLQLLLRDAGFKAVRVLRKHFRTEDGYVMEVRESR